VHGAGLCNVTVLKRKAIWKIGERYVFAQEWATGNNIALPHRETRTNAAQVFKWEEESPGPTSNILQVDPQLSECKCRGKAATDTGARHACTERGGRKVLSFFRARMHQGVYRGQASAWGCCFNMNRQNGDGGGGKLP
jgi:hypothetical protein